jgi:hypothetical protein
VCIAVFLGYTSTGVNEINKVFYPSSAGNKIFPRQKRLSQELSKVKYFSQSSSYNYANKTVLLRHQTQQNAQYIKITAHQSF